MGSASEKDTQKMLLIFKMSKKLIYLLLLLFSFSVLSAQEKLSKEDTWLENETQVKGYIYMKMNGRLSGLENKGII
jgi:hypothetical protein